MDSLFVQTSFSPRILPAELIDHDWPPQAEYKKRKLFYEKTDWAAIEALFVWSSSVGLAICRSMADECGKGFNGATM